VTLGKVECIAVEGLDLWFNSHDHLPAHFHVRRRGEYELRIYFLLCTKETLVYDVKWGNEPAANVRSELRDLAVANRVVLLDEWERKVCPQ
jgi:hypothetical protein